MPPRKIVKTSYMLENDWVESMAEVSTETEGLWKPDENLKIIGKPVSRIDGYDKVSGTAQYTFDVQLPNMGHAKILRCPHPHARIKSVDTSEALKHPGVLAIITHENTPKIPWYDNTSFIFDPHLRYVGDDVACVAAETLQAAEEALEMIRVEYEILPFVVDTAEAMKPEAPKLYDTGNIQGGEPNVYKRGDYEKGLKEADVVVEDTFITQVAVHNPSEVHCSVANWDGDGLTVWDSTQAVFGVRDAVAKALDMPASKVRVIKKYMGGGFGSKLDAGKYTVMAALLARLTGRPIKLALNRKEQNLAVGNRPNSVQTIQVGVKKDGTITAMTLSSYGTVGAYPDGAGCHWPLRTLYRCDNVKTKSYSVFTNAGQSRAMRAPGHVQGTFALESIMDEVAEKIGMDPLEFRLKNYADKDQVFNLPYTSKRLREAYEKAASAIDWNRHKDRGRRDEPGEIRYGIGMATQIWWGGGEPPAYATLKLNRDGSAHVLAGTQDLGTGTYTFIAMVAAEVLEISIEKITVTIGDTADCPYCNLSGGSLTAPSVSPAVHDAAQLMKSKLVSAASAALEIPETDLKYEKGTIFSIKDNSKKITITEIFDKMNEQVLIATGARNANPKGYAINTFGVQVAEVEVDTRTGKVSVIRIVGAYDVGRILNPKTAENQFHGGILQGIGFALMEQRIIDNPTGKVLTAHMHNYKMPTIHHTPDIQVFVVSTADMLISRVGAKGLGEPAHIPTAAAIANAVSNAIGVRIKQLPITPDRVLNALSQKR